MAMVFAFEILKEMPPTVMYAGEILVGLFVGNLL